MADLTAVPILRGLWVPWFPQSVLLRWPFCWWVGCIVDHASRRVIAHQVYSARPGGAEIAKLLDAAANDAGTAPKYLITDLGPEFANEDREAWCLRRGVVSRYASADHHRATSVIERFFRSLKQEAFRLPLHVVPSLTAFEAKLKRYIRWFNEDRPHQGIGGRTPNEVYEGRTPANRAPRFEPRTSWPRNAVCAGPQARPKRKPGGELVLDVHFVDDDPALPKIELRRAA